jgi:hypothetical protein
MIEIVRLSACFNWCLQLIYKDLYVQSQQLVFLHCPQQEYVHQTVPAKAAVKISRRRQENIT